MDTGQAKGPEYTNNVADLQSAVFEMGPIRPPSEGGSASLLLRVTRNCPWSRCGFCYGMFYHREKFRLRPIEEVKAEIDTVKFICDTLESLSWSLGHGGKIQPLASALQGILLSGRDIDRLSESDLANFQSVVSVFNWVAAGQRTVFLQDADTPIMPTGQLVEVLDYLKQTFPSIVRITSYARSKTVSHKTPEELRSLREAGLTRLHIGLETGDDELLAYIDKGVTAAEHIAAGRKAKEAGFELSEYVMPGLGGKKWWEQHARNTARVLNEIDPDFIRFRPFVPSHGTPMLEACERGEIELTSPHERLREIRLLVENLEVTSGVCFDHNFNASYRLEGRQIPLLKQDYNGYRFPDEKQLVLDLIDRGLAMDEKILVDLRESVGVRRF